jgi:hypothetical protein
LCEIFEALAVLVAAANAEEEAEREAFIEHLIDREAAKQLAHGQNYFAQKQVVHDEPPRTQSIFELQAKAEALQGRIITLRAEIPRLEKEKTKVIEKREKVFTKVDEAWSKRQVVTAQKFTDKLNDALIEKQAEFSIKMDPLVTQKLQNAFVTSSPAAVLRANPALAESPHLTKGLMENMNDFVRELRVLTEINRAKEDPDNKKSNEEIFSRPSMMKTLAKLNLVPRHTHLDSRDTEKVFNANKPLVDIQKKIEGYKVHIKEMEKSLNRTHDQIQVLKNTKSQDNKLGG